MKGAADALGNPEAGVMTRRHQATTARKAWGLQDKRNKGGLPFGNRGGDALEGTLASHDLMENISNRERSRREVGGAEERRPRNPSPQQNWTCLWGPRHQQDDDQQQQEAGNREGDQGQGRDLQGQGAAEGEGGLASQSQEITSRMAL